MRIALLAVILAGGALALYLATGAANPPYAGPAVTVHLLPANPESLVFHLPANGAYTLEIEAVFTPASKPLAWWGISLDTGRFAVRLTADGYFQRIPDAPDSQAFLHLRPPGHPNILYLHRTAEGQATLRFNHEIAWYGLLDTFTTARIRSGNGARIEVIRAVLYASDGLTERGAGE